MKGYIQIRMKALSMTIDETIELVQVIEANKAKINEVPLWLRHKRAKVNKAIVPRLRHIVGDDPLPE